MKLPEIKGFIDLSLVDWDGQVSAVMFLPHCNFRCPFCYNLGFVLNPKEMQTIPYKELEQYLTKNKGWLDGIVITGGEPTIHNELPTLIRRLKEFDFKIKLDTNGSDSSMVQKLTSQKLVDYIALDVKAPLIQEKYSNAIGVSAEMLLTEVEKTVQILLNSSVDYELRTTLVPTIHGQNDIKQICTSIKGSKKYVLQSFKGDVETLDPKFKSVKPFSQEEMGEFLKLAKEIVPNAFLR